jgi:hypothetical protein
MATPPVEDNTHTPFMTDNRPREGRIDVLVGLEFGVLWGIVILFV